MARRAKQKLQVVDLKRLGENSGVRLLTLPYKGREAFAGHKKTALSSLEGAED